jgi:hypothetical protein
VHHHEHSGSSGQCLTCDFFRSLTASSPDACVACHGK